MYEEFKMDEFDDELYHHGVQGQKWGIRRYQNKDGSLTPAGVKKYGTKTNFNRVQNAKAAYKKANSRQAKARARANARTAKEIEKYKNKNKVLEEEQSNKSLSLFNKKSSTKPKGKTMSDMSDDEIRAKIQRIQLENQLKNLQPEQTSKGKKFIQSLGNDVLLPAAKSAGKDLAEKYMKKVGSEMLGLDDKEMDKYTRASKESQYWQNMKSAAENKSGYEKLKSGEKSTAERYKEAAEESKYWTAMNNIDKQQAEYNYRHSNDNKDKKDKKDKK